MKWYTLHSLWHCQTYGLGKWESSYSTSYLVSEVTNWKEKISRWAGGGVYKIELIFGRQEEWLEGALETLVGESRYSGMFVVLEWYIHKKSIVDGIINSPYINKNGILKKYEVSRCEEKNRRGKLAGVTAEAHSEAESQVCANGRKGESTEDPDMEERLLGTDGDRTWECFQSLPCPDRNFWNL